MPQLESLCSTTREAGMPQGGAQCNQINKYFFKKRSNLPENKGINTHLVKPGWAFNVSMHETHPARCPWALGAQDPGTSLDLSLSGSSMPQLTLASAHGSAHPPRSPPLLPTCYFLVSDPSLCFISCIANSHSLLQRQVQTLCRHHRPTWMLSSGLGRIPQSLWF